MREQFEKLPKIAELLNFRTGIYWNDANKRYNSHDSADVYNCTYLSGAWYAFQEQQAIINDLKVQLENMEQCYIEKKKQVEAVSKVLCELKESMIDFQEMDLYDKGHRVTTEYVITDLEEALRGES